MNLESRFRKMANMVRPKGADDAAAGIVLDAMKARQHAESEGAQVEEGARVYATDMDRGNYNEGTRLLESGNLSPERREKLEQALQHMRDTLSFDQPGAMDHELLADAHAAISDAKRHLDQR